MEDTTVGAGISDGGGGSLSRRVGEGVGCSDGPGVGCSDGPDVGCSDGPGVGSSVSDGVDTGGAHCVVLSQTSARERAHISYFTWGQRTHAPT